MSGESDFDSRGPRVLFESEYSYRRAGILAGGVLLALLGVFVLVLFTVIDMDDHSGYPGRKYMFPIFGLVMGIAGGWNIWAYASGKRKRLIITDRGIRYGDNRWNWEEISKVGRQEIGANVTLYIELEAQSDFMGTRSKELLMPLTPPMTLPQYRALSDKLYDELAEEFPDLEIK